MREVVIDDVRSSEGMALLVKRIRHARRLRIALMSSESSRDLLAKFVTDHVSFFGRHDLVATSGTATALRAHTDLPIESVGHGPDGGDIVIAHKILVREIDALIFLRSGTEIDAHGEDVRMLLRVANMCNCVSATNVATATLVLRAIESLVVTVQEDDQGKTLKAPADRPQ